MYTPVFTLVCDQAPASHYDVVFIKILLALQIVFQTFSKHCKWVICLIRNSCNRFKNRNIWSIYIFAHFCNKNQFRRVWYLLFSYLWFCCFYFLLAECCNMCLYYFVLFWFLITFYIAFRFKWKKSRWNTGSHIKSHLFELFIQFYVYCAFYKKDL